METKQTHTHTHTHTKETATKNSNPKGKQTNKQTKKKHYLYCLAQIFELSPFSTNHVAIYVTCLPCPITSFVNQDLHPSSEPNCHCTLKNHSVTLIPLWPYPLWGIYSNPICNPIHRGLHRFRILITVGLCGLQPIQSSH